MSVLDVSALSYVLKASPSSQPTMSAKAAPFPRPLPASAAAPPAPPSPQTPTNATDTLAEDKERQQLRKETPPLLTRFYFQTAIATMQGLTGWGDWYRDYWDHWMSPPRERPDIVKSYEVRPSLPVRYVASDRPSADEQLTQTRIFIPKSHPPTAPGSLPVLFTIHGGGFSLGTATDDDAWNRRFADMHYPPVLVVALSYSKAPRNPFPTALYELKDLVKAVVGDESLPVDRDRTAVLGFSAGGNLAMGVGQLLRERIVLDDGAATARGVSAAVSVYGALDLSLSAAQRKRTRFYKKQLPGRRGEQTDYLEPGIPVFDWAYIPYGQDLRDPLLSPAHAPRERLPNHVFVVGCELDVLAHEAWRAACRWANEQNAGRAVRKVPGRGTRVGRQAVMRERGDGAADGVLELNDDRFHWEDVVESKDKSSARSVRWLLLPDMLHGTDHHCAPPLRGDAAANFADAARKADAYMVEVGRWLMRRAWGMSDQQ
jgi:acetyl esterase/lipase